MNSSSFLISLHTNLIADASVVISLNATLRAVDIVGALPGSLLVTENTCTELEGGIRNGHRDYEEVMKLIDAGLVQRVQIGASIASVYESLIDGSALRTLDDGEAATIAYAHQAAGVALIDERKARTLCAASFPGLVVASTVELLLHDAIALALGEQGQAEVLASALMKARMRVPPEHLERVRAIIGAERAAACSSLTRAVRKAIA